jgi:uncharacterized protein YodC (DUF2158 family)
MYITTFPKRSSVDSLSFVRILMSLLANKYTVHASKERMQIILINGGPALVVSQTSGPYVQITWGSVLEQVCRPLGLIWKLQKNNYFIHVLHVIMHCYISCEHARFSLVNKIILINGGPALVVSQTSGPYVQITWGSKKEML